MDNRTRKIEIIERVSYVVINNHLDSDDLVSMLEITPEDILERFEDRMYEHQDKFLLEESYDQLDESELEQEEETEEPFGEGSEN